MGASDSDGECDLIAGIHPPFSFRSCRKENGLWTVQKKRTLCAEPARMCRFAENGGLPNRCLRFFLPFCRFAPDLGVRASLAPRVPVRSRPRGGCRKACPSGFACASSGGRRETGGAGGCGHPPLQAGDRTCSGTAEQSRRGRRPRRPVSADYRQASASEKRTRGIRALPGQPASPRGARFIPSETWNSQPSLAGGRRYALARTDPP